ncbi:hypothetical protein JI664_21725 [Rhodobacter sp. NTK016B]|uniref:hypothetical protein n=1 Tax=Rhodobacter sp. NTK016B TaxID=2759676 RepID=UPI001A8EEB58|nr:hypothetical protein [Rhodobacter sp. NTK016B]MBN8294608.1 hypothetical protein [Rhodobacter sp. NTK016B]
MNPLDRKIRLLRNFVRNWDGEVVDTDEGLIRLLNKDGTRPPLIWCFNAEHEPAALARALGPDQPLIALRSLNIVSDHNKKAIAEDTEVAQHYVRGLLSHFDLSTCWVGGNCQGATIAVDIARLLLSEGKNVRAYFCLEWTPFMPLPTRCVLLFGETSEHYNPFLRGENPWPQWRCMYESIRCKIIPGGHGTYFRENSVGNLAAVLIEEMSSEERLPVPSLETGPVWSMGPGETILANQTIAVQLTCPDNLSADTKIYALWLPLTPGGIQKTVVHDLRKAQRTCSVSLTAPEEPGNWTLQLFLCRPDDGPLSWQSDLSQVRRAEIVAER